eukprot:11026757-Prorocentrum_lima.AAC.1
MTSSLVGSEMCIRDRVKALCLEKIEVAHNRQQCLRRSPRNPVPGDPVSYTHLTLPTICSV